MRRFVIFWFLIFFAGLGVVRAQQGVATLGIKCGENTIFGPFAAFSAEGLYSCADYFSVQGGVQYNTVSRISAEVRPAYFHDFQSGRLSAQLLLSYTYQSSLNNYVAGCGVGYNSKYIGITLGYYFRAMAMGGQTITEPFNIYYTLDIHCLPNREKWDLNVIFSNSRPFELERHYQPSLSVEGWWFPLKHLGVQLGVNYKPAGMFNLSSDYYQFYTNVGVCYRW